jgi:DNA polymerase-3 subunit epsilon
MRRAVDTVQLARRKFPGQPASLDALCSRFNIDNTQRTLHGALLDAELLSEVYLELVGGRQATLLLASNEGGSATEALQFDRPVRPKRDFPVPPEELAAHAALIAELKNPIWLAA